jgi:hypothetical protein
MTKRVLTFAVIAVALAWHCIAGETELPATLLYTGTNPVTACDGSTIAPVGEPGSVAVFAISNSLREPVIFTKHDCEPLRGYVEVLIGQRWHTRFVSFLAPCEFRSFVLQPRSNYCFSVSAPTNLVWKTVCYGQVGTNIVCFRSAPCGKPGRPVEPTQAR